MLDRILCRCVGGQCYNSGSCLERHKICDEEFPCRHCACHGLVASVVSVSHPLCIVEHHDGGGHEYSGSDLHGACVWLIHGGRGCVVAMEERRRRACRCCCWPCCSGELELGVKHVVAE